MLLIEPLGLDGSMIRKHAVVRALALTVFLFGLLTWAYVIIVQITHPSWVYEPFSHVAVFPLNWRVDEVGMAAFAVAAVGFLVWQIDLNSKNS